jgi:transcriptional regulator NrdR family protein
MVCIYCGAATQVTNSRLQKRNNQVWRRRACTACYNTFTTHEKADLSTSLAVQYSIRDIRPFSRDTLYISLYESCKHRPAAITDADGLTQTVIALLRPHIAGATVHRDVIVTTATAVLKRFDATAAAVYAAFHKL